MQNLNDYKWTKIELNKSAISSVINQLESWENIGMPMSDVSKMNLKAYKLALAENIKFNFGIDDTIEFEIIVHKTT